MPSGFRLERRVLSLLLAAMPKAVREDFYDHPQSGERGWSSLQTSRFFISQVVRWKETAIFETPGRSPGFQKIQEKLLHS